MLIEIPKIIQIIPDEAIHFHSGPTGHTGMSWTSFRAWTGGWSKNPNNQGTRESTETI